MKKIIVLFLTVSTAFSSVGQDDKTLVEETVSKAQIKAHIQFLASDAMKGRDTPSPELDIAASYLANQLELFGAKAFDEYPNFLQPVYMEKVSPPSEGSIKVGQKEFNINEDFLMIRGASIEFDDKFIWMDYGTEENFKKAKVKDKWIVTNCGDGEITNPRQWFALSREKRTRAAEAGALGLIELYNSPQLPWSLLVRFLGSESIQLVEEEAEADYNHIWLNNPNNESAPAVRENKNIAIQVGEKTKEPFTTYNVVGYIPGTEKENEYVVYSGHYDHVGIGQPDSTGDGIYNGTRDNAVGTTTVLSVAKNLGKYPTRRSALFILFTGEEKGLLGSEWYVEHSPVPLKQIVYCFNSDNGGYNDTSIITILGLFRTTVSEEILLAGKSFGLGVIDDPAPEQGLFDRSDNVNFAKKGIPAPTFSMGFTAFDQEIMKYYHQPSDNPNSVDYDYLYKFFKSYVMAARLIANREETPFWVEGDKYYEAGVALYGK